jgi:hypothetical protein
MEDEYDDDYGAGIDAERCSFFLFVAFELTGNTKVYLAECVLADVRVPQVGEHLAHCMDGFLHCSRAD